MAGGDQSRLPQMVRGDQFWRGTIDGVTLLLPMDRVYILSVVQFGGQSRDWGDGEMVGGDGETVSGGERQVTETNRM